MRDIEVFELCVRRVAERAREVMPEDTATIALFEELAKEISRYVVPVEQSVDSDCNKLSDSQIWYGPGGLAELKLSTRPATGLRGWGIFTIDDLCKLASHEVRVGKASLTEIREALSKIGRRLCDE